jgi:cyclohexanone monooxygenase
MNLPSHVPPLDAELARRRFSEERMKRLRPDGEAQYILAEAELAHDPWTPRRERPPVRDHVRFTFVGGGFAGLLAGAELVRQGIGDVRIIDRAGDFGGVWYWNRYPGLMCDSPALLYLPLLEETGHVPTEKYVHQPEILAHCGRIGRHFGLYERALFHTGIVEAIWDEVQCRWTVLTDRGDQFTTDFLGLGLGFLSTPKLPGIPGIEDFRGHAFHASRWDYAYTGGAPGDEALTGLADKRVAVIGTGATAIQCVGPVAAHAKATYVFQRTPSAVYPRRNEPLDAAWFRSIATPGWQQRYTENYILNWSGLWGQPFTMDPVPNLLADGFTEFSAAIRAAIHSVPPAELNPQTAQAAVERTDLEGLARVHAHVDAQVSDKAIADKLKPWYRAACKRPTFNDDYLAAFNRPNTHLVDTDGRGVELITADGVVAGGKAYPVDCIVYASGFDFSKGASHAVRFAVRGEGGRDLREHWKDGLRSLHGMHVAGFPNLFIVQLAQGADFAPNIPTGWQDAGRTLAAVVAHMQARGLRKVVASAAHEAAWTRIVSTAPPFPDLRDCTPGLLSHEGRVDPKLASYQGAPDGPRGFFKMIANWRASGTFSGLEFSRG